MHKEIVFIYGGEGEEHEVSVNSAKHLIKNINKEEYSVTEIFLDKNNNYYLNNNKIIIENFLKNLNKDILIWPVFHGPFGEGGEIQKIFEKYKVNFVGTGSLNSKIAMDKFKTQKILSKNNINVPNTIIVTEKFNFNKIKNFPVILKPVDSGSSVDLYKCKNLEDLEINLKKIFKKNEKVMLQDLVEGREFTCGVIEKKNKIIPLHPTEIILNKSEIFDYKSKYTPGGCLEITPARINYKLKKEIQDLSVNVHKIIGCIDISRTDLILNDKNELVVLEINTIPGMTKTSFIPKQLESNGIKFKKFINIIYKNHIFKGK